MRKKKIGASKLGNPPSNPPAIEVYGITHVLKFTVNTDKSYHKLEIPSDYAGGDITLHLHWTKSTTNSDQSNKNVKWQIKYLLLEEDSNCNSGESTLTAQDTYISAVSASQIIYTSPALTIPANGYSPHKMIMLEGMAITPTGDALSDEPALIALGITYKAKNVIQ